MILNIITPLWLLCALITILKERKSDPKTQFGLYLMYAVLSPLFVLCYLIPEKKHPVDSWNSSMGEGDTNKENKD